MQSHTTNESYRKTSHSSFDCYRHPAEASREAAHGACTRIAIRGRRGSRTCRGSPHDGETSCQSICCVPTSTQPPARLQWRTMYIAKFDPRRSTSLIREAAERCFVLPQCECRLNARPANTVGLVRWRCDPVSRGGCVRVGLQDRNDSFHTNADKSETWCNFCWL